MKANDKQKQTIQAIGDLIKGWQTTNDIHSPSHYTIIEEAIYDMDLKINTSDLITDHIERLYDIIKHIK